MDGTKRGAAATAQPPRRGVGRRRRRLGICRVGGRGRVGSGGVAARGVRPSLGASERGPTACVRRHPRSHGARRMGATRGGECCRGGGVCAGDCFWRWLGEVGWRGRGGLTASRGRRRCEGGHGRDGERWSGGLRAVCRRALPQRGLRAAAGAETSLPGGLLARGGGAVENGDGDEAYFARVGGGVECSAKGIEGGAALRRANERGEKGGEVAQGCRGATDFRVVGEIEEFEGGEVVSLGERAEVKVEFDEVGEEGRVARD